MNPSKDASTAPAPEAAAAVNQEDDDDGELQAMLEEVFADMDEPPPAPAPAPAPPAAVVDSVKRYHETIRRALVDWGDEIIDTIAAKFADTPRLRAHLEDIRKDMIDPLRAPL